MDEQTLARLEARLRYYEDIGIRSFYSSRTGDAAATERVSAAGPSAEPCRAPEAVTPSAVAAAERVEDAAPEPLPVIGATSLFDSAERIEGDTLERIREDIGECTRCKLHKSRSRIVFGDGNSRAKLVFVGEGPGQEEDRQGLPFVGRAGKLLTQMIEAMGLARKDVYICNVVKCRPPSNRTPENDETSTCQPFLERQLAVIRPKVIVCLGNVASQALLGGGEPMSRVRGKWFKWRGAKLLPTYHPAYLLRNPNAKGIVWEDLQKVMAELGLEPPKKRAKET
ncbi:MAG: uracil-DNA glycosylase [Acidobacteriota bacterium]|nr:uracil-DNA glycosylase [Acidobacteriota bacterium]